MIIEHVLQFEDFNGNSSQNGAYIKLITAEPTRYINIIMKGYSDEALAVNCISASDAKHIRDILLSMYPIEDDDYDMVDDSPDDEAACVTVTVDDDGNIIIDKTGNVVVVLP